MGQQDTSTKHPADIPKLIQWPGQTIKPHEARAWGQSLDNVIVKFVPTKDNSADMLTKAMDNQTFARHRAEVLNLDAA